MDPGNTNHFGCQISSEVNGSNAVLVFRSDQIRSDGTDETRAVNDRNP